MCISTTLNFGHFKSIELRLYITFACYFKLVIVKGKLVCTTHCAWFLLCSINQQDGDGCTLLHLLVKANMTEYVKIIRNKDLNASKCYMNM
jgi:hypothetical protein